MERPNWLNEIIAEANNSLEKRNVKALDDPLFEFLSRYLTNHKQNMGYGYFKRVDKKLDSVKEDMFNPISDIEGAFLQIL